MGSSASTSFLFAWLVHDKLGTKQKGLLLPVPNPSEKNPHLLCGTLTGKVIHEKNEIQIIARF